MSVEGVEDPSLPPVAATTVHRPMPHGCSIELVDRAGMRALAGTSEGQSTNHSGRFESRSRRALGSGEALRDTRTSPHTRVPDDCGVHSGLDTGRPSLSRGSPSVVF